MPPLRILEQPELREPTLIAAFAGWSDAGSAATAAAQYLVDRWHAQPLAEFEAEEFYDFTQLRPTVSTPRVPTARSSGPRTPSPSIRHLSAT